MTATDELRRMLDERGVEWSNVRNDGSESNFFTEWQFDGIDGRATATEWSAGNNLSMAIYRWSLTPEQAIAATLGRGTCHMEYRDELSGQELYPTEAYECSACGGITADGKPDYCPYCGREVVE